MMSNRTVAAPLFSSLPDSAVVERLQRHRADPSVSVLLTTTPAATLVTHDVVRLHRLFDIAAARLAREATPAAASQLAERLRELAVAVRRVPARRGLCLFASEQHAEVVQLPI